MKIKTSELIGIALDRAVAKALNIVAGPPYSTNWYYGGPLLESECICLNCTGTTREPWEAESAEHVVHSGFISAAHTTLGDTMLVAGMRCIVLTHIGEEVELSETL